MSSEIVYRCDVCKTVLGPKDIPHKLSLDSKPYDLCKHCYSKVQAYLFGHTNMPDEEDKNLWSLGLVQKSSCPYKFAFEHNYVTDTDELFLSRHGLIELLLTITEADKNDQ